MMPTTPSLSITWQQSTFLLPLFCLCPLLASTNSLAVAIGLSIAMLVTTFTALLITFITRRFMTAVNHSIIAIIISSTLIAILELLLHAWSYELFRALGLFLPLLVIACLLITRPEMQAQQITLKTVLWRGIKMNAGFLFAAVVLGSAREIIGHGTLFYDATRLLGMPLQPIILFRSDMGFLLAVLAPGAFIGLGIGVALYNWIWLHLRARNTHDHA